MSTVTITKVLSDISKEEGAHAVFFSVNNKDYALDLTDVEEKELISTFDKWVKVARTNGVLEKARKSPASSPWAHLNTEDNRALVRIWAKKNNVDLRPIGRIPGVVWQQWEASRNGTTPGFSN